MGRQEPRSGKRELEHYKKDDIDLVAMRRDDWGRPPFRRDDRPYFAKRCRIEDTFISLNTLSARIFTKNKSTGCFKKPYLMAMPPDGRLTSGPYCLFHEDYGHVINKYLSLKKQIDLLVKRGLLAKYAEDNR